MNKRWFWLYVLIVVVAAGLRWPQLELRPMHTDEAVHAEKFKALFTEGLYAYDPYEYHGPTLNYLTLIPAWLGGLDSYESMSETTLRIVPVVFGVLLVLMPLLVVDGLGIQATFFTSLLIALSPGFTYYSRYYIMEILLVFFTAGLIGCGWRYIVSRKLIWAVAAGGCIGLMHATKETCVITLVCMLLAFGRLWGYERFALKTSQTTLGTFLTKRTFGHILIAFAVLLGVSAVWFSSFGTHPDGILDSFRTYSTYLSRGVGGGIHDHPWWYYLDILTWVEIVEKPSFNEDIIIVMGGLGIILSFRRNLSELRCKGIFRYLAFLGFMLFGVYSIIPYKTPWSILSALLVVCYVAGVGIDWLLNSVRDSKRWYGFVVGVVFVFAVLSPGYQSWLANFRFYEDQRNPYVYAHTDKDVFTMLGAVRQIAESSVEGNRLAVQVIGPDGDYWPWPWYLRSFEQVGYWGEIKEELEPTPLILCHADFETDVVSMLYAKQQPGNKHLYISILDERRYLRPGVQWRGYLRKDYWDRWQYGLNQRQSPTQQTAEVKPVQKKLSELENIHHFSHEAMATVFELLIQTEDVAGAQSAAREAFELTDRLEAELSRFRPGSDISRINTAGRGEVVSVSLETIECLKIVRQLHEQTGGAFDPAVGRLVRFYKDGRQPVEQELTEAMAGAGLEHVIINESQFEVTVLADAVELDLGGIGKGYAVDKMVEVLKDYGFERGFVSAGASTVRAMNAPNGRMGWPVNIVNPLAEDNNKATVNLVDSAMSCSGLARQYDMIDPSTGRYTNKHRMSWVFGPRASNCDGLSTAAMIMDYRKASVFCRQYPAYRIMILPNKEVASPVRFGQWEEFDWTDASR